MTAENAIDRPAVRRTRKEIHTSDLQVGQAPDLTIPLTGPIVRENESIAALDTPMEDGYFDALKFAEEMVTIRLERTSEKYPRQLIDVHVNGKTEWIPVGIPYSLPRKYVEILARAKQDSISAEGKEVESEVMTSNVVKRFSSQKYPFSVIYDPSPKGAAWITRLLQER